MAGAGTMLPDDEQLGRAAAVNPCLMREHRLALSGYSGFAIKLLCSLRKRMKEVKDAEQS